MVIDYEAVLADLQAFVASKSQHGREGLLIKIAELAHEHRVPAGELPRLLRLYGIEVERARLIATKEEEIESFAPGEPSDADPDLSDHHRPEGHDGRSSSRSNGASRAAAR